MQVDFAAFWLHKDGGEPREYEDAFAPSSVDALPRARLRCAVADGATESAYSRIWARQLVSGYASGRLTAPDFVELPVIGRRWAHSVTRALERTAEAPWYLERKADHGAFAAFIGLDLEDREPGRGGAYAAIALGDSCFVQIRAGCMERAFPLDRAVAFNARPVLLPSRPAPADEFAGAISRVAGAWKPGDTFYVMSDALACWFLSAVERGGQPWREIDRFKRSERAAFRRWVHALRGVALKNDDVTLLRITLR
jgi:hypothetical protein